MEASQRLGVGAEEMGAVALSTLFDGFYVVFRSLLVAFRWFLGGFRWAFRQS